MDGLDWLAATQRGVKPEKLDELEKKVDEAREKAAGGVLRGDGGLPFERGVNADPGDAAAPRTATIPYPNGHKAKVVDDPADPDHFGFTVDDPAGQPVSVPTVPGMEGGQTQTSLPPSQVPKALKEVEKLDRGEKLGVDTGATATGQQGTQFATRTNIVKTRDELAARR